MWSLSTCQNHSLCNMGRGLDMEDTQNTGICYVHTKCHLWEWNIGNPNGGCERLATKYLLKIFPLIVRSILQILDHQNHHMRWRARTRAQKLGHIMKSWVHSYKAASRIDATAIPRGMWEVWRSCLHTFFGDPPPFKRTQYKCETNQSSVQLLEFSQLQAFYNRVLYFECCRCSIQVAPCLDLQLGVCRPLG